MTGPAVLVCLFLSASPPANQPVVANTPTEWYRHSIYEVMLPDSVDFKGLMDTAVLIDVHAAFLHSINLWFETTDPQYQRIHVYFPNLDGRDGEFLGLLAETLAILEDEKGLWESFKRSLWISENFSFDFNEDTFTIHRLTYGQVSYVWPRLVTYVDRRHDAQEFSEGR